MVPRRQDRTISMGTIPKKKEIHNQRGRHTGTPVEQRYKPDLTEVIEPRQYIQNEEQNFESIWNKIIK